MRSLLGGENQAAKSSLADIEKRKKGKGENFRKILEISRIILPRKNENIFLVFACEAPTIEKKVKNPNHSLTILFIFAHFLHLWKIQSLLITQILIILPVILPLGSKNDIQHMLARKGWHRFSFNSKISCTKITNSNCFSSLPFSIRALWTTVVFVFLYVTILNRP